MPTPALSRQYTTVLKCTWPPNPREALVVLRGNMGDEYQRTLS
jgi:hypothetical protein